MAGNVLIDAQGLFTATGLRRGMRVADFGVGNSGHIVFPAARRVGEEGHVYAVDISKDALAMIEGRRRQYLVHNVDTVWGDMEQANGVSIPAGSLHMAYVVNTLGFLKDHLEAVKEIRRLMHPTGRIVVVDWHPETPHPVAPARTLRIAPHVSDVYFLSGNCEVSHDFRPSNAHWGKIYRPLV